MNKVYVVLSDWCESTDLFGVYNSFESAKKAILNWAGGNGKWISGDCFETNYDGMYRIITRVIES